jgi:uncharacterized low-complexity protein
MENVIMNKDMKKLAALVGASLAASMSVTSVNANDNPFGMQDLSGGYQISQFLSDEGAKGKEGKCGEGKCGEAKKKGKEGKCGEAKEKGKEGKCGEGKCGEAKKKGKEGKCGAAKDKGKEGKCGA